MFFRNTKNRRNQAQSFLRSKSLRLTKGKEKINESDDIYEHTYGVPLPESSIRILAPCIDGLTGGFQSVNPYYRELHTIGIWSNGVESICRCCFVQPEIATATCTIPSHHIRVAIASKAAMSDRFPGAPNCGLLQKGTIPQVSGRMAPYVIDDAGLTDECKWGFMNACKTKILFVYTDSQGPQLLSFTTRAMSTLKAFMPDNASCVYDDAMSCYKVTAAPVPGSSGVDANKNSCMVLYSDGAVRFQGTPSKMLEPCRCFRQSLVSIAQSRTWPRFLKQLSVIPLNPTGSETSERRTPT